MNEYYNDIFYRVDDLSLEDKIKIIDKAKELSFKWNVDVLDCAVSWGRQRIDMSYDNIMKKFNDSCHFVVIHRRGYEDWKDKEHFDNRWCGEIGFSTMTGVSNYLWVWLSEENLENLISIFNLKPNSICLYGG